MIIEIFEQDLDKVQNALYFMSVSSVILSNWGKIDEDFIKFIVSHDCMSLNLFLCIS